VYLALLVIVKNKRKEEMKGGREGGRERETQRGREGGRERGRGEIEIIYILVQKTCEF
jgi:hypothetical protein